MGSDNELQHMATERFGWRADMCLRQVIRGSLVDPPCDSDVLFPDSRGVDWELPSQGLRTAARRQRE